MSKAAQNNVMQSWCSSWQDRATSRMSLCRGASETKWYCDLPLHAAGRKSFLDGTKSMWHLIFSEWASGKKTILKGITSISLLKLRSKRSQILWPSIKNSLENSFREITEVLLVITDYPTSYCEVLWTVVRHLFNKCIKPPKYVICWGITLSWDTSPSCQYLLQAIHAAPLAWHNQVWRCSSWRRQYSL